MENSFSYYALILVAIVIGILLLKKTVSCAIRTAIFIATMAALAYIYFFYLR